jgi:hypothetical protein
VGFWYTNLLKVALGSIKLLETVVVLSACVVAMGKILELASKVVKSYEIFNKHEGNNIRLLSYF